MSDTGTEEGLRQYDSRLAQEKADMTCKVMDDYISAKVTRQALEDIIYVNFCEAIIAGREAEYKGQDIIQGNFGPTNESQTQN